MKHLVTAALLAALSACASVAPYTHEPGPMLPKYREPNGPYQYTSTYRHPEETYVRTPEGWQYVVWHPHNLVSADGTQPYLMTVADALDVADEVGRRPPPAAQVAAKPEEQEAIIPETNPAGSDLSAEDLLVWQRFCNTEYLTPRELAVIERTQRPASLANCVPLK